VQDGRRDAQAARRRERPADAANRPAADREEDYGDDQEGEEEAAVHVEQPGSVRLPQE